MSRDPPTPPSSLPPPPPPPEKRGKEKKKEKYCLFHTTTSSASVCRVPGGATQRPPPVPPPQTAPPPAVASPHRSPGKRGRGMEPPNLPGPGAQRGGSREGGAASIMGFTPPPPNPSWDSGKPSEVPNHHPQRCPHGGGGGGRTEKPLALVGTRWGTAEIKGG